MGQGIQTGEQASSVGAVASAFTMFQEEAQDADPE
jgi:hypothetical protein